MEKLIDGLLSRIQTHLQNRTTDLSPSPSVRNSKFYTDSAQFVLERERIFRQLPLPVAFSVQLPKPGDWISVDDFEIPVILVRDESGIVHGLYNRCRHRGSRLTTEKSGNAHCFSCPYHAWTYGLNGALKGVPHSAGFSHLAWKSWKLESMSVQEHYGIIWMQVDGKAQKIDDFFSAMVPDLEGYRFGASRVEEITEVELSANWKILTEAFLEGYHIKTTHRKTFGGGVLENLSIQDRIGLHTRGFYPLKKVKKIFENGPATFMQKWSSISGIYQLFPHSLLAIEPFQYVMLQFVPISISKSRARMTILSNPLGLEEPAKFEKERALLKAGIQEDYEIAQMIQRNLDNAVVTGKDFDFHFGLYEGLISHFHEGVDKLCATSTSPHP